MYCVYGNGVFYSRGDLGVPGTSLHGVMHNSFEHFVLNMEKNLFTFTLYIIIFCVLYENVHVQCIDVLHVHVYTLLECV